MSTEDRMSDIKSVHVGHHHVCQGEILAEFLKITYGVIRSELSLNWEGACSIAKPLKLKHCSRGSLP